MARQLGAFAGGFEQVQLVPNLFGRGVVRCGQLFAGHGFGLVAQQLGIALPVAVGFGGGHRCSLRCANFRAPSARRCSLSK
nr:MAG TPA: hypothetical protein [Caudoviricetes sp.]